MTSPSSEPPRPDRCATAAEFAGALKQLRTWSGRTFRELERIAAAAGEVLPSSTTAAMLSRATLPREDLVAAFARACGLPPEEADRWTEARRRLALDGDAPHNRPVPRRLPPPPWSFTGRAGALAELDKAVDVTGDTEKIVTISGMGGVGKTWLALQWAHRNADRFPDGQLHLDLRGFAPAGVPMPPHGALRGLLEGLGTDAVPADPDAQTALYRTLVAGRRMLIILDDAADSDHVLPLLPGGPDCVVLVTSRRRCSALTVTRGARQLPLDVLTADEAHELVEAHLGRDRTTAEPDAVAAILDACAGLPLALAVAAVHAGQSDLPLAAYADELREARLDALDTGELHAGLRAVFASSYRALGPDAATLFRLLGRAPGPHLGLSAVARLTGNPRAALRELERAHLIRQEVPGRYRMHDLVRWYASELAKPEDTTAVRGLVDFLLHTAQAADAVANPHHEPLPAPAGGTGEVFADPAAALAWFDAELRTLLSAQVVAADHGWDAPVWQLAWAFDAFLWRRGHLLDHVTAWKAGLSAAERLGDEAIQARAHRRLGHAWARTGNHDEAASHLRQALASGARAGDVVEQARTHDVLAWSRAQQGDVPGALAHAERTLELHRSAGSTERIANALNAVGWYHAQLARYAEARQSCEQALELHEQRGDRDGRACTLDSLGYIAAHDGRLADAITHYRDALALFRELGNRYEEANTLVNLGDALRETGKPSEARTAWREASDLYRAQHREADADRLRARLSTTD